MIGAWNKKRMTATGTAVPGACEFGGIICQTFGTGTTVAAYDATSAVAADVVINTTTLAANNDFTSPTKGMVDGCGIGMKNGIHVVIGGTGSPAIWVLYR